MAAAARLLLAGLLVFGKGPEVDLEPGTDALALSAP